VFISHSSVDAETARDLCERLEAKGVSCWIAPRDETPGHNYAEEIIKALDGCKAVVLVLSDASNASRHVASEISRAFGKGKLILPVRVKAIEPSVMLELFVSPAHWIDLFHGRREEHVAALLVAIRGGQPRAVVQPALQPRWWALRRRWVWAAAAVVVAAGAVTWAVRRGSAPARPTLRGEPAALSAAGDSVTLVPRYQALVIGINDYSAHNGSGWGALRAARGDAEAVADVLERRYGFEVTRLLDGEATRAGLIAALDGLTALTPDDAVLVYYAGHGYYDETTREGYWIPSDARKLDGERQPREDWVWNSTLNQILQACPARHVLVVADSCYGGSLFRGETPAAPGTDRVRYARALARPSRYLIASGALEPVPDQSGKHSAFAAEFLNGLESAESDFLAASDLAGQIRKRVGEAAGPMVQAGPLAAVGHGGGEFVFVRQGRESALGSLAAAARTATPAAAATPPEPAPDRTALLQSALALGSSGATGAAQRLLAETARQGDDPLVRAVTAYLDQQRRARSAEELRALVKSLEQARQEGRGAGGDAGAARPRILACLGPVAPTAGKAQDSLALLYRISLRSALEVQPGVQIIEREALEQVLQEQGLGASGLADARAATTVGKLLPAGMLLLGDLLPATGGESLFLRLVDTETTRVLGSFRAAREGAADVAAVCEGLATQIVARAVAEHPLAAAASEGREGRLTARVGRFHGAAPGMAFDVVLRVPGASGDAADYREEPVGTARVVSVSEVSSELSVVWREGSQPDPSRLWVKEAKAAE
jgi:hypothetical protein